MESSTSSDIQAPTAKTSSPLSPPRLRPARFEDYPQIERLEAAHLATTLPAEEWPHLWLDNPLWPRPSANWPIGWVLEDGGGRVVGSMCSVPTLYRFRGRELVCANARAWVSHPGYRGYAPWLMEEFFTQPGVDLCISTTANAKAEPICAAFATRIPLGQWDRASFWITSYFGFANTALRMKKIPAAPLLAPAAAAALSLRNFAKPKLPTGPSGYNITFASEPFDARFDAFWTELLALHPAKLLAVRDSANLNWHYALPIRHGKLWTTTATDAHGSLRAYCIFKRQDHQPSGLRRMRLIDYQTIETAADLLPALLKPALTRCAQEKIHVLENIGHGVPKMHSFDHYAPHHRPLLHWKFYYRATDPSVDQELSNPQLWDPSTYDGDSSFD
jgi:hypothetical protein